MSKMTQHSNMWFDLEDRILALDLSGPAPVPAEAALAMLTNRQTACVRELVDSPATSLDEVLQKLLIWQAAEGPTEDFEPDSDFQIYGHLAVAAIRDLQKLLAQNDDEVQSLTVA